MAARGWRLLVFMLLFFFFGSISLAQNATTDPSEARALNSIFEQWGITAQDQWNISGEVCSGVAIDGDRTNVETDQFNRAIKCDCSYDSNTTCHITLLRVYAVSVTGPLPDELWNLTYLTNLNLAQNYLTGPIPASIANLTRMQYLSLGINALSGELPKELGLLTDLRSLSFSSNNFSGPLPSELGSLTRLTQIYFDSAGVSGPIPQTFAKLRSLAAVWASDNELTEQIPDFIGNWSGLKSLLRSGGVDEVCMARAGFSGSLVVLHSYYYDWTFSLVLVL